jgi:hypothetical protein
MECVEQWSMRRVLRTNVRGKLPNLAQAVLYEVLRRPLFDRPSYAELATIFARATGKHVTSQTIANFRNKLDDVQRQCVPTVRGRCRVRQTLQHASVRISTDAQFHRSRFAGRNPVLGHMGKTVACACPKDRQRSL